MIPFTVLYLLHMYDISNDVEEEDEVENEDEDDVEDKDKGERERERVLSHLPFMTDGYYDN